MKGSLRSGWLLLGGILWAGVVLAQTLRMVPVPPHLKPNWTSVPENPKVFHAPNVPADIFRGPGGYYLFLGSSWYHSRTLNGPWTLLPQVPEFLTALGPGVFKSSRPQPLKPAGPPAPSGLSSSPTTVPSEKSAATALGDASTPPGQAESTPAPAPEPVMIYDPGPP